MEGVSDCARILLFELARKRETSWQYVHCQTLHELQFKFVILVVCERECFAFRSVRNVISVFKNEELLIAVSEVNGNEIIRL